MILADTSAWIEFDRATGSPADQRITELIATDGALVTTEPVLMEVLAGARTEKQATDLRRLLLRGGLVAFDSVSDFDGAVRIYRLCLQAGVTPRGLIDCMIAAVAWRVDAALLSTDVDLVRVARVVRITMADGSRKA